MGRTDAVRLPEESKSTRDLNVVGSSYLHQSRGVEHRVQAQPHSCHQPTTTHVQRSASPTTAMLGVGERGKHIFL